MITQQQDMASLSLIPLTKVTFPSYLIAVTAVKA